MNKEKTELIKAITDKLLSMSDQEILDLMGETGDPDFGEIFYRMEQARDFLLGDELILSTESMAAD